MRLSLPDVIGLLIGFALGGSGLALLLPDMPEAPPPDQAPPPAIASPDMRQSPPRATMVAAPPPVTSTPMPRIVPPERLGGSPPPVVTAMPNVIRPTEPSKQAGLSGTGFFITSDGLLMTAAHLVDGCRTTEIASRHVGTVDVRILAVDRRNDLALLRARNVRPPMLLAFAAPPASGASLAVYGYPSGGDALSPTEARGTLRDGAGRVAAARVAPGQRPDPRDIVWIEAGAVRQGFSGGPIVGPGGAVVGMLQGIVVDRDRPAGNSATGIAVGPGTRPIGAFLHREIPQFDMIGATRLTSATTQGDAGKAVVHVHCRR